MRFISINCSKLLLLVSFLILGNNLFAQDIIKVSGTVSDAGGSLQGVNVKVKGTTTGVMTDTNGKFTVNAPSNGELVVSYIGFEPQTISINGQTTLNIELKENIQSLDEVVVVGYGTMKKRDITGSITSVSAKEIEKNSPVTIASALQGKVSGLDIMSSSEPGAGSSYRIRGASTLSDGGSKPLFIVDGMEVSNIDNINPRDIASIEVLKDAASTAIYGSKSANGVFLITTKEGNSLKPKVSLGYSLKQSEIAKTLPQMNRIEGNRYETLRNYFAGNYAISNRDSLNPAYTDDNFYQELLFRKAYTSQVDASISGADKKLKYYISMGYLNEEGIQINTYNKRLTSRINVDYNATSKLTIGNRVSFTLSNQRMVPWSSRANLLNRPANFSVIEPDGSYTPVIASRVNPLAASMLGPNDYKTYNIYLNEFLEYKILPELRFRTSISGNMYQSNYNNFSPAILDQGLRAKSTNSNNTGISWTYDDVLTYSKTFKKDHAVTVMGGFSLQESTTDYTQLSVTDNVSEGIEMSNAYGGVNMGLTRTTWTGYRMASFFGRATYSYKGRYLFNSNIRYDGSSRFGSAHRWGFFPSASVAWRFSDEAFMKWSRPALKDAKIRLSYGVTGNQNAGNFASLDIYSTSYYADYLGLSPSQLSNPDLGWEQTKQFNAGLDLTFLEGRLTLVMDYYKKQTSDVLYLVKLPQTTGFKTSYRNVGNVDNNGFEFTINSTNIKTKDFEWSTSLNLSFNKNMIMSIPEGGQQFINNVYILDKGYAVGTMYGWKRNAIFSYDQSNAFTPEWKQLTPIFDGKDRFTGYQLNGQTYTGDVKQMRYSSAAGAVFKGGDVMWDDVDKNGVIDANDRQVLGCGQPDVMGGFNTEFRYKDFTLSAFFSFALGGDVYNRYEEQRSNHKWSFIARPNPVNLANSWLAPGDVAMYPKPDGTAALDNTREASSLWIEDGSYIRMKNLRLGYRLPAKTIKFLGVESMDLSIMIQNFFTWTNYSGFDPEIPSLGYALGYDNNSYPKAKDILVGINLNF